MRIPLSAPDILEEEIQAVAEVLRTPNLSLGPKLHEFEQNLASYLGGEHAVAVSSGTAGLHVCIRALGISEADEVIVPSFAFIAVANAVRYERGVPVFVDVEPETLNLDPARIEAAITPRTKAILLVHTFGCPADLSQILEIAHRHHLFVIEDACEAIGAEYEGRKVGLHGDAGIFGFYPNKQITTGEGGAVVTADPQIAARVRALRNQGRADSADWFEHSEVGYNYRLSELNCALGIAQLTRIKQILGRREEIAGRYHRILSASNDLRLPLMEAPNRTISWFVYVVRLAEHFSQTQRDWIAQQLLDRGIGCGRYFAPIHLQAPYKDQERVATRLSVTEHESVRCLALPFFNGLRDEQVAEVCDTLLELIESAKDIPPAAKAATSTSRS